MRRILKIMKEETIVDNDREEMAAFYVFLILYNMSSNDEQRKMVEDQVKANLDKDQQEDWFRMAKNPFAH